MYFFKHLSASFFFLSLAANAQLINHEVKFKFLAADGTPVTDMTVISQEHAFRSRCKPSLNPHGSGHCNVIESASIEQIGSTDAHGEVSFIYDKETRIAQLYNHPKLQKLARKNNLEVSVYLLNSNMQEIKCVHKLMYPGGKYIEYVQGVLWNENNKVSLKTSKVTCILKD
jgi:hypothetical protein